MKQEITKISVCPGVYQRGPKKGQPLLVRLPVTMGGTMMPEKGMMVPDNPYWHRRLRGGDIVKTGAIKTKPTTAPASDKNKAPKGSKS